MNNQNIFWIASLVLAAQITGLSQAEIKPPVAGSAPTAAAPAGTQPAYKAYDYLGEKFRDPFVPLLGDGRAMDSSADIPPPIASLSLKGIVEDKNGRVALLASGASSYVLRGGRLYDGRNRMVKKISGVVKADSVVMIGADRTVRELRTTPKL